MSNSAFGFDKPEESPGYLLWQTTITWQRRIKLALEPYKISHAQFVILAVLLWLEETDTAPIQKNLVNMTKLDKMTVSAAIKKLVGEGYIKRNEHKCDTRAKCVLLTKTGRAMAKKLIPIVEGVDEDYFSQLNTKEQHSLIKILNSLNSEYEMKCPCAK